MEHKREELFQLRQKKLDGMIVRLRTKWLFEGEKNSNNNNNNNVHLSCAHQRLSAHMIHINLHMIFYTHVEHSPTKTIYVKYYTKQTKNALQTHTHTHTHNDCSRNWVLILVRMEIL